MTKHKFRLCSKYALIMLLVFSKYALSIFSQYSLIQYILIKILDFMTICIKVVDYYCEFLMYAKPGQPSGAEQRRYL